MERTLFIGVLFLKNLAHIDRAFLCFRLEVSKLLLWSEVMAQ